MQLEQFHDRVAAVRRRFASTLNGKIKDTFAELANLRGEGNRRRCGRGLLPAHSWYLRVAAAVGFPATGRVAKTVEDGLVAAYRAGRGLTAGEAAQHQQTLEEMSVVAAGNCVRPVSMPTARGQQCDGPYTLFLPSASPEA